MKNQTHPIEGVVSDRDEGLRPDDGAKLLTLATWFDAFDDWREATGKIAPGIAEYRDVQTDLRRIGTALASQPVQEQGEGRDHRHVWAEERRDPVSGLRGCACGAAE